jgi:hypothetical protein
VENVLSFLIVFFVLKSRSATTIVVDNFHISRILASITKMFFTFESCNYVLESLSFGPS